jgi:PAS domain S-box-containing protein
VEPLPECPTELTRQGRQHSRLIVDSIPGLVALLSAAGELEFVNRQVLEYTGRTLEELKQWASSDTTHPDDVPHVARTAAESFASGTPYEMVHRLRRWDGTYRRFQNNSFPLRDTSGRIVGWCALLTDIEERKRTEDALRERERESRLIVDSIPGLVATLTPDGEVEVVNNQVLAYCGRPLEELKQWATGDTVHSEDRARAIEIISRSMVTGDPYDIEERIRRFDGVYQWFQVRGFPLRDSDGRIIRWYVLLTDIEERKRAHVELRRAYDSFADAQRLSRTGNFTADIDADEHVWSDELYRIFEFDPQAKITAQAVRAAIHPEDLPTFDQRYARSLDGAEFDHVFRINTASGTVKHVHASGRLIERVTGRRLFIGAIQDVTENKNAEAALNRARSELAHVARVTTMSMLTASIAHEVNQPLTGVIANAGACLRTLNSDPPDLDIARETARRIIRDGNRTSDVITRLRALFSKKEAALESVDLNEAIREVIALSINRLQRNGTVLQPELADNLPLVTGDRIQLQQVMLNLLRNGSEAMLDVHDRPRQLLIKTERDAEDRVRVIVRDAGVGIDPQRMDRLFEPFFTTKSDGMGVGLSVSRSIIERHQGRLWAEPNDGPGATFVFVIPCAPASPTDAAPTVTAS